jgi:purine-binding chemotaxis protein CheW
MVNGASQLVIFCLEQQRYAVPLAVVERVIRAVEVTPLPKAPPIVLGAIDVGGRVVPVLNIRRRFRLTEREMTPEDQFVIARAGPRAVALVVDAVEGAIDWPAAEIVRAAEIAPGIEHVQGVIKHADGLILIHDLETFLSLDETRDLAEALTQEARHARG